MSRVLSVFGCLVASSLLWGTPAHADSLTLRGETLRSRSTFVIVGGSMVDNTGLNNGVRCLEPRASATISPTALSARSRLRSATLYIAGSLIGDGVDYPETSLSLLALPPTLPSDEGLARPIVEQVARETADQRVLFRPPGSPAPVEVVGTSSYISAYYIPSGTQAGWVAFFVTAIDVTDAILGVGNGVLPGTYEVSGLLADVCNGLEAVCGDATHPTCLELHTFGTASFALLLTLEDPALPLNTISVFEGLESVARTTTTPLPPLRIPLDLPTPVSSPPEGSLAFFALEGDLSLGGFLASPGACSDAEEYIEVDGDATPTSNGLCLSDADNPLGNIFNSTINVQSRGDDPLPVCATPSTPELCCQGDGLCPVTGVDIDRFDISSALVAGSDHIEVRIGTGADRIAMGPVVISARVYEPELSEDSQIRILDSRAGSVQLGGHVTYSIAVSNTGNVPATGVHVRMGSPPHVSGLQVISAPPGAVDASQAGGGSYGTGLVDVGGFEMDPGKVAEVRVRWRVTCAALGNALETHAEIEADDLSSFDVLAPSVNGRGPGTAACDGRDAAGPFSAGGARALRGGGGCTSAPVGALGALLIGVGLAVRRRRHA
ncbi:MAG: hypothetical protein AAB426_14120 [Myxococcota bacterium]